MECGALDDFFAKKEITELVKKFKINRIVETGTYLGWSTKILSDMVNNVDTIEVNKIYYNRSKLNLSDKKNINTHYGNSPEILNKIINKRENILFFLDAHWDKYWPLKDELNVISEKKIKPVICIHDFFVPNGNLLRQGNNFIIVEEGKGSKFGYDEYENQPLTFDLIKKEIYMIYGDDYEYHYTEQIEKVNSGIIYIYPKKNDNI
jgi:hypothetical protein